LGLNAFNDLPTSEAVQSLLACCSSPAWAQVVAAGRPYASVDELLEAADAALAALGQGELDAALAGHPRIGEPPKGAGGAWSRQEQAGLDAAQSTTVAAIAEGNRLYEKRFGHVYLVCASGRSADELLGILRSRLGNDEETEWRVVREELAKINRIRLGRLVGATMEA
jgi:2-oxo-4-hydroxy-4-carboxy-5-ureidoimidazoline decarboxylase